MKRLFLTICMFVCCLGMSAQDLSSLKNIDPALLPKGVTIEGDSLHVDLEVLLSDSVCKALYIQEINRINAKKGITTRIYDMKLDSVNSQFASKRQSGRRKAEAFSSNICEHFTTYDFHYQSVDTENQPITLSGRMYIPTKWQFTYTLTNANVGSPIIDYFIDGLKWTGFATVVAVIADLVHDAGTDQIKWGILCTHPTVTSNYESPTGGNAPDAAIYNMTSERALVVCPDYLGYGYTKNKQHPYLVQDITARNCIDGYLAALDFAEKKVDKNKWSSSFFTTILGYSQGGSVALACTKYLQSGMVSKTDRDKINLRETYCGDGPYSPVETVKQYVKWANDKDQKKNRLAYPCVLPLIMEAAKQYYDKGCMRTVKTEDYFTKEFLATGIVEDLKSKNVTTEDLNNQTKNAGIYTIDQMLSDKMITKDAKTGEISLNTSSNECKCLMRALGKADLTTGWVPEKPVYFFHFSGDLVVPYANLEPIKTKIANGEWPTAKYIDAEDAYKARGFAWALALGIKEFSMTMHSFTNDTSTWNHVNCGTVFFVWFMAGCPTDYWTDKYWREVFY